MIQANAKCIVNGDKVNETIMAVNSLMNVDIVVGNVDEPQVKYFSEGFLIVLPRGSSYANEELNYVDVNNDVASRWFVTSASQASTSPVSTSGTPTGKQSSAPPTSKDRNSLGNTPSNNNRDQLSMNTGGALRDSGGGVAPTGNVTGGALRDDRKVDQFGNTIGGGGALRADGFMVAGDAGQAARDFDDTMGSTPKIDGGFMVAGDAGQAARDFDDTMGSTPKIDGGFMVAGDAGQAARDFDDTPNVGAPPLSGTGGDFPAPPKVGAPRILIPAPPLSGTGGDFPAPPKVGAPPLTPTPERILSSEPSRLARYMADKTKRENDEMNRKIKAEAAAIAAEKERKADEAAAKKAEVEEANRQREAKGEALRAKAAERNKQFATSDSDRAASKASAQAGMEGAIIEHREISAWIKANRKDKGPNDPEMKAARKRLGIVAWEIDKYKKVHLQNVNNRS